MFLSKMHVRSAGMWRTDVRILTNQLPLSAKVAGNRTTDETAAEARSSKSREERYSVDSSCRMALGISTLKIPTLVGLIGKSLPIFG